MFESVEADVVPLDELVLAPAIIKIDAEGFDYDVLRGATETIARSRPFIMVEAAWSEQAPIVTFFHRAGYAPVGYDVGTDTFQVEGRDIDNGTSSQRNLFGIPRERLQVLPVRR